MSQEQHIGSPSPGAPLELDKLIDRSFELHPVAERTNTAMIGQTGERTKAATGGQKLKTVPEVSKEELRAIDREYLCWGDTVHYQEKPIIVSGCQGGLVFDRDGNTYIDMGM